MPNENDNLKEQVAQLQKEVAHLTDLYFRTNGIDNSTFSVDVKMNNSVYFGKAGKVGFFGKTPILQGATIADPSGGATVDSQARTAINSLIDRLQDLGLIV